MIDGEYTPKVPFRIGFEGLIEPSRIPSLIKVVSELATTQSIDVQFLDAEGDALEVSGLLEQFEQREIDPSQTVSRDVYITTVKEQGVSAVQAGRSWAWLARRYNDYERGEAKQNPPVRFTETAGPGSLDTRYRGKLYVESLRQFILEVEASVGDNPTSLAISRTCGGDVGLGIFGIWKTFLETWTPPSSEE